MVSMERYPDKTSFAREHLSVVQYREQVKELENELHALSDKLREVKIDVLKDQGYNSLTLDETTILVPKGMTFEQLYLSLQQMPPPDDRPGDYALTYLVSSEDRHAVNSSKKYQNVVERRQDTLDKIIEIYQEFWKEEVEPVANSDEESIVYMMAGLDREITASTLSLVTGVEEQKCKSYSFDEENVVVGP